MATRRVNQVTPILVALALFLGILASPIRQAFGSSGVGRPKPSRRGIASKVVLSAPDGSPAHSVKVGLYDPSDARDETDGDAKVESSLELPPAALLSEFVASSRLGALRDAPRLAAAGASRPLRC